MCQGLCDKDVSRKVLNKFLSKMSVFNGALCETLCREAGVWTTAPVTKLCAAGSFLINLCLKDVTKMVCDTGGVHESRCVTKVCVRDGV